MAHAFRERKKKQENLYEFEANLIYVVSSKPTKNK